MKAPETATAFAGVDARTETDERFAAVCETGDAREGIAAFLEGDPLDADEWPGE